MAPAPTFTPLLHASSELGVLRVLRALRPSAQRNVGEPGGRRRGDCWGPRGGDPDYEAMSAAMTASMLAFPAETVGLGNRELTPQIAGDGGQGVLLVRLGHRLGGGPWADCEGLGLQRDGPLTSDSGRPWRSGANSADQPVADGDRHPLACGLGAQRDGRRVPVDPAASRAGEAFTYEFVAGGSQARPRSTTRRKVRRRISSLWRGRSKRGHQSRFQ